ncbi:unnamed protein product [Angiostrongylus costaricensis]|uniref:Anthocyanin 5-aromatic acyltransferase n=1 Tax=Angiostrongylus costaricensis TaxID=334426 RepID=A0A158PLS3_ANGCS|nr:unnamed protein product [Angiostrongylus costaricensis]
MAGPAICKFSGGSGSCARICILPTIAFSRNNIWPYNSFLNVAVLEEIIKQRVIESFSATELVPFRFSMSIAITAHSELWSLPLTAGNEEQFKETSLFGIPCIAMCCFSPVVNFQTQSDYRRWLSRGNAEKYEDSRLSFFIYDTDDDKELIKDEKKQNSVKVQTLQKNQLRTVIVGNTDWLAVVSLVLLEKTKQKNLLEKTVVGEDDVPGVPDADLEDAEGGASPPGGASVAPGDVDEPSLTKKNQNVACSVNTQQKF